MTLILFVIITFFIYYYFIHKNGNKDKINVKSLKKCPSCASHVENNFNVCPICKETLKRKCLNCGEKLDVLWNFCPYCEEIIIIGDKQDSKQEDNSSNYFIV